jgi:hypothetical protein
MVISVSHARDIIQRDALISGIANAVINGIIGWFMFRSQDGIPLTIDSISAHEKTVLSTGVMTAFMLSLILGTMAFFAFRKKAEKLHLGDVELLQRPFFFFGLRTVVFYSLLAFGTVALGALFLQKFLGSVLVAPLVAGLIIGVIAGLAAWFINASVMRAMLRPE